jgi:hypothetical protein
VSRAIQAGRWAAGLLVLGLVACAGDGPEAVYQVTGGTGGDRNGAGGNSGEGGAGSHAGGTSGTAGVPSDAPPPDCVGEVHEAKELPVAMYIMLDRSGSMLGETGAGPTKWDATVQALSEFVQADGSSGLWVGLQYFPLAADGVPESCQADADCGPSGGMCLTRACLPAPVGPPGVFSLCLTDLDCPLSSPGCAPFGVCEQDDTLACFTPGDAQGCQGLGACEPVDAECENYASCEVADYAAPAVAIDALPGNAPALVASLAAAVPLGLTPTSAALTGALEQASDFALSHPDHAVIAVLATDGTPSDCEPITVAGINAIAEVAAQASPSLHTHVIGVFAPEETDALRKLDSLAEAGGSNSALIVDPTQDVSAQLLAAFDEIRAGTVGCELQLPPAPVDLTLDFNRVNVELTEGSDVRQLTFVDDISGCRDVELGWYYDRPLGQGAIPGRIVMCRASCDAVQSSRDASVSIRLGCLTRTPD